MEILLVHTGGTIGSCQSDRKQAREQNSKTVKKAKRYLTETFKNSDSRYAKSANIIDSKFPNYATTLSESMTTDKLSEIIRFIRGELNGIKHYDGIIVLHGTDTLAYTASLFSFIFSGIDIPMFLVSGNRPPEDPKSNAVSNFISAVELICDGIAPNVYVTYLNSDKKMRLFMASCILQSANFSEDFISASGEKVFEATEENLEKILLKCSQYSEKRIRFSLTDISEFEELSKEALLIRPYTGLDYSAFKYCFGTKANKSYKGVVHGTYHSGTVSWPGLVLYTEARNCREVGDISQAEEYEKMALEQSHSEYSVYYLANMCEENNVPLYIAPSSLGSDQYETMNVVTNNTNAKLLNMSTEAAYAKLITALSFKLTPEQISEYMKTSINNEFI